MKFYEVYVDGGCRPNPGLMMIAISIPQLDLEFIKDDLGQGTANRAEYLALIYALKLVKNIDEFFVYHTDSQIVHGQLIKGWRVKRNKDLYDEAKKLLGDSVLVKIPRNVNKAGKILETFNRDE